MEMSAAWGEMSAARWEPSETGRQQSGAWREPSETGRETSDARQEAGEAGRLPGCETLVRLNQEFLATRESAELRSATVQMGFSLRALVAVLPELPDGLIETLKAIPEPSLPYVWSGLAAAWSIAPADSVTAYLWSWAENQVLVAMKSVPVGQSSGQRILLKVGLLIEELARRPGAGADTPRSNFAPGLAILSSQHETQYSRLFRS
jgi:urease accessory protein